MIDALPVPTLHITKFWLTLIVCFGLVMLLGTLFYPMGYDQAAFMVGGEMVAKHGAVPYRDLLDTKPPIIFYIYSLASILFGHHVWSIRALDLIYQLITLTFFFRLIQRFTGRADLAVLACVVTGLQYIGSGFWMTAQAESFALLPSLGIVSLTLRTRESTRSTVYSGVSAGLLAAVLFLLKFTFLMLPLACCLFLVMRREQRTAWKFIGGMLAGFIVAIGIYAVILVLTGSLHRFVEAVQWVSRYAAIDPLFSRASITERYYVLFPGRLISTTTFTLLIMAIVGAYRFIKEKMFERSSRDLFILFGAIWVLQIVGIAYERKLFPYHFTRAFWALSPFIAIGLEQFVALVRMTLRRLELSPIAAKIFGWGFITVTILLAMFFSPLPQMLSQPVQWTRLTLGKKDVGGTVEERIPDYFYKEQQQVGSYLKARLAASDQIFFWGNDVGIYFFSDRLPTTPCLTATPLRTAWTPQAWKQDVIARLKSAPPKYVISEFGDVKAYITGDSTDSYEALQQWSELSSLVTTGYAPDTTIGHFKLFRRVQ